MPRNSGGTYSLPAGNPVVTGTTIASVWANTTMSDIATALTGSLARNGDGGMTGQFLASSGAIGAPGISWSSETTSGWYRQAAGNFRFAIAGADIVTITAAGLGGNGSALTNLNATNISSGSLADARLSANVPLKNAANAFTAAQSITTAAAGDAFTWTNGGATPKAGYLYSDANIAAIWNAAGGGAARIGMQMSASAGILLETQAVTRVVINNSGNVTVNAPSSGVALTVSGTVAVSNGLSVTGTNSGIVLASLSTSGSASVGLGNTADGVADGLTIGYVGSAGGFSPAKGYIHYSGTSLVWFNTGYTQTMSLDSSGNLVCVGNVTAFSDVRLKNDVETIQGALGLVRELRGITYARKDNGARGTGLIAQDVQTVLPEAVATDENGMLSVAYGNVTGLLVEAIKELNGKLDRAGIY